MTSIRTTLVIALFASAALAQGEPAVGPTAPIPPIVTRLRFGPIGDIGGQGDDRGALSPALWVEPLRLTLMNDLAPVGSLFPGCAPRSDPSGNSIQGFALQRSTFLRLTPTLTLHGFSSAGCPVDAAAGGGVTQTIPLRANLALVASAGAYARPAVAGLRRAQANSGAGIDLVKKNETGGAWWMGIGATSRAPQGVRLRFGGSF